MGGALKKYPWLELQLPFVLLKSNVGLNLLDRSARLRFVNPLATLLLILLPLSSTTMAVLLIWSTVRLVESKILREVSRAIGPLVNILLPGLNPYIPLIYGWLAVAVAILVHEGAHGVIARANGMKVKSAGLLFFLALPIGAFVELDDKEIQNSSAVRAGKVLAAGPGLNLVVAVAALTALLLIVGTMTPVCSGVLVTQLDAKGPAYEAGVKPGDVVTSIDGIPVSAIEDIRSVLLPYGPGRRITVEVFNVSSQKTTSYAFELAPHPMNHSRGYMGLVSAISIHGTLHNYVDWFSNAVSGRLTIYLILPTLGSIIVPFSEFLRPYYTSSIAGYACIADLLFWIWFVNFNLAMLNSLPIYPLDGGIAFKTALKTLGKGRLGEKALNALVTGVSAALVFTILAIITVPYLF